MKPIGSLWSGRRGSCLVRSHLTAIPHFVLQQFHCFQTKVLQPPLAHATRSVARSSPLAQANKKEPFQDSFLLAGDEARTRDILLGKEAFYH